MLKYFNTANVKTYTLRRSTSDFFCSVGDSGVGGVLGSKTTGPAISTTRLGLAKICEKN
jgi:hypothetical protein